MTDPKGRGSGGPGQAVRFLAADLAAQAEWQRMLGVVEAPVARGDALGARGEPVPGSDAGSMPAAIAPAAAEPVRPPARPAPAVATPPPAGTPSEAELAAARSLDGLRGVIGDCRRCRLHGARTQVVFGVGNPRARVVFVGEGPGRDEDLQGEPFVGRAGQLLTDIIEKGMKLSRADVYICNVVKCRPPQNRNPEPDEVATCSPFLVRQIELVGPEVLVTLGKFAAHALLSTDVPITRLRGQWQDFRGIPVMPTFHPAYLLRNPAEKKTVWQDIKLVMARLGLPS